MTAATRISSSEAVSTNLRSALYALATDKRALHAPEAALGKLRILADVARGQIALSKAAGGTAEAEHAANVRLTDAAVAGLLHFARATLDVEAVSMIAPVSCVAVGDYAAIARNGPFSGGLLILLEDHALAYARGRAIAVLMARGLLHLGMGIRTFTKTVDEAGLFLVLPEFAGWRRQRRLIAGQHDLFIQFLRPSPDRPSIDADRMRTVSADRL
jgi:hypothetical protein